MEDIVMRAAAAEDYPAVAGILSTTEAWTSFGVDYDKAMTMLQAMPDEAYVAVWQGQVVGFVTLRREGVGNIGAYLRMIVVKEEYRGRHIGEMLIDYVSGIAFQGTKNVFLICALANTRAQEFYERVGFVKVGIMSDLLLPGHDEVLYRKTAGCLW